MMMIAGELDLDNIQASLAASERRRVPLVKP